MIDQSEVTFGAGIRRSVLPPHPRHSSSVEFPSLDHLAGCRWMVGFPTLYFNISCIVDDRVSSTLNNLNLLNLP
jgi:hypothetical protein